MIVAVIAVRMVQPAVHKVVHVVTMRDGFVSATRAVLMVAMDLGSAAYRILLADLDDMLIDSVPAHMLQVAVLKIIDVIVMAHCRVPAVGAMHMPLLRVMVGGSCCHWFVLSTRGFCREGVS